LSQTRPNEREDDNVEFGRKTLVAQRDISSQADCAFCVLAASKNTSISKAHAGTSAYDNYLLFSMPRRTSGSAIHIRDEQRKAGQRKEAHKNH